MSGWGTLQAIRALEDRVRKLGFEISNPKDSYNDVYGDRIALTPVDDKLPHYSRDAKVWIGTLEELRFWLDGVEWARNYDEMLKLSSTKKRSTAESTERNRQLMATIKKSKLVQGSNRGLNPKMDVEVEEEIPF